MAQIEAIRKLEEDFWYVENEAMLNPNSLCVKHNRSNSKF